MPAFIPILPLSTVNQDEFYMGKHYQLFLQKIQVYKILIGVTVEKTFQLLTQKQWYTLSIKRKNKHFAEYFYRG